MKAGYTNRIKEIREKKRLTQEFVAEQLKMTQRAYSSIENNRSALTVERLLSISEILETPASELLGQENTGIHNNFNYSPNKGNLIINQSDYEQLRELYERIIAAKDAEIDALKKLNKTKS